MKKVQKLQFELMEIASFNEFVGEIVVKDLVAHEELWRSVLMNSHVSSEFPLRDMPEGYWSVSTLFIYASNKDNGRLWELANLWGADEVDWIVGSEAGDMLGASGPQTKDMKILRVWWD
jgi:hypothetical protein